MVTGNIESKNIDKGKGLLHEIELTTGKSASRLAYGAYCEKHRLGSGPCIGQSLDRIEHDETEAAIEIHGLRFGVDHNACAAEFFIHAEGQLQHESKQLAAQPPPLRGFFHRKTRKTQHGYRVVGELFARHRRQTFDFEVPG